MVPSVVITRSVWSTSALPLATYLSPLAQKDVQVGVCVTAEATVTVRNTTDPPSVMDLAMEAVLTVDL